MTLKIEVGSWTKNAGASGNQTVTLADASFGTVKAVLITTANQNGDANTGADGQLSMGFGTYRGGTAAQFCTNYFDTDGSANSACAKGMTNASILHVLSAVTPTVMMDANLVSLGDHEFVINWNTDTTGGTVTPRYMAFGGDDISDALVISPTCTTGTGNLDITVATGFGKPDLVLSLASRLSTTANGDAASSGVLSFGLGFDHGNEAHTSMATNTSAASMTMGSHQSTTFLGLLNNATTLGIEAELAPYSTWPTDGFRVNKLTAPAANTMFGALALKGSFSKSMIGGSSQTSPSSFSQAFHNGTAPRGAIFFHDAIPAKLGAVDSTAADLAAFSIGMTDGTNESTVGAGNDNGNGTSVAHRNTDSNSSVRFLAPTATGTPVLSQAAVSFSGNDVVLTYSAADTLQREYRGVILGDGTGAPIAWTTV